MVNTMLLLCNAFALLFLLSETLMESILMVYLCIFGMIDLLGIINPFAVRHRPVARVYLLWKFNDEVVKSFISHVCNIT